MISDLNSPFTVEINGQVQDYRIGHTLAEPAIWKFFQLKGYKIENLNFTGRHYVGKLLKNNTPYFLKLATSLGQNALLENEVAWCRQISTRIADNDLFEIPKILEAGNFQNFVFGVFQFFEGYELVSLAEKTINNLFVANAEKIVDIADFLAKIKIDKLPLDDRIGNPQAFFVFKTQQWRQAAKFPPDMTEKINQAADFVSAKAQILKFCPRHGDFAPWHLQLNNGKFGLFDAEHASIFGVETYDLAFLIQRIFSELQNPEVADFFVKKAIKKGIERQKFKITLLSRAIGGFLDESLKPNPVFLFHRLFLDWALSF